MISLIWSSCLGEDAKKDCIKVGLTGGVQFTECSDSLAHVCKMAGKLI